MTDERGWRYISLMGTVYKLANALPSLPSLTTNILRTLFVNLKDDSLVFLIGILMQSLGTNGNRGLCVTALRHATSFLKAQPNVDFQVILPSLVVAMQDADSGIREAALECVEVMVANNKDIQVVYGFDVIYGESSGVLHLMFCHGLSNVKSSCSLTAILGCCRLVKVFASNPRIQGSYCQGC